MVDSTIIDQFKSNCTPAEAMQQFADRHFGEPRKVDRRSVSRRGSDLAFQLVDGRRWYRIADVKGVWVITLDGGGEG